MTSPETSKTLNWRAKPWLPHRQVLPEAVPSPLQSFQWEDFAEIQYEPAQQALHQLDWLISDAYPRLPDAAHGGASDQDFQWAMSVRRALNPKPLNPESPGKQT